MPQASKQRGSYALLLQSDLQTNIRIGRRGEVRLQQGYYMYAGSALGPGGLASRLKHHKAVSRKPHWHIDYLRKHCELVEIWYTYDEQRREHDWANCLLALPHARVAFNGFGASDCQCQTHLVYFSQRPDFRLFRQQLLQHHTGHAAIFSEP
jgi:Uri superfamily endonuclease